jgi:hypothetical protein
MPSNFSKNSGAEFGGIVSRSGGGESPEARCLVAFRRSPKIFASRGLSQFSCVGKRLKIAGNVADPICMFMPSTTETPISEMAIAAFCAALNTPVVNIEDLEVGPARAAIMLSADDYGLLSLVVRVSLISSGEGVTFRFQDDPAQFGSHSGATEAALGFAEGMGFLFEEDLIESGGPAGRQRAWNIWCSLMDPDAATDFEDEDPASSPADGATLESDFNRESADEPVVELANEVVGEIDADGSEVAEDTAISFEDGLETDALEELELTDDFLLSEECEDLDEVSDFPDLEVDPDSEGLSFATDVPFPEDSPECSDAAGPDLKSPVLTKFRSGGASGATDGRRVSESDDRHGTAGVDRRAGSRKGASRKTSESGRAAVVVDPLALPVELARTALRSEEVGTEVADNTGSLTRLLSSF